MTLAHTGKKRLLSVEVIALQKEPSIHFLRRGLYFKDTEPLQLSCD